MDRKAAFGRNMTVSQANLEQELNSLQHKTTAESTELVATDSLKSPGKFSKQIKVLHNLSSISESALESQNVVNSCESKSEKMQGNIE